MASGGEFDGYEFSNNLVSDLAPIVALFGEQVTTQFLGLSMGWADNVLLAMGPLGIITILMSAIRIGGGRKLKSLVGRAREPQAVAEQELLSSTSANVCELWNGQQVVRIIGEPIGMKTVVAASDGTIQNLRDALQDDVFTVDRINDQSDNKSEGELSAKSKSFLDKRTSEAILELPANLSLNARSKPVSAQELWSWAIVGIVLQACAIAFPAVATYYFDWKKGSTPVVNYGYPCFVAGTVTLTIGIILCGHIIEGATLETNFMLSAEAKDEGLRILCLQEALTVGDQHFPSCVISLAEEDHVLRTSRRGYLKHGHTWSRATATTLLTISGYIAQFVGLRALHWSATLVQLAMTLIMTGIRAFASHFMPWLTLVLRFEAEKTLSVKDTSQGPRRRFGNSVKDWYYGTERLRRIDFEENQFFCELISDHSQESSVMIGWLRGLHRLRLAVPYIRDETGFVSNQLLQSVEGPLKVSLEFKTGVSVKDAPLEDGSVPNSLLTHAKIAPKINETNQRTEDNDYEKASAALCEAIEEVMEYLSETHELSWTSQIEGLLKSEKSQAQPLRMYWGFDIREGRIAAYCERTKSQKHVRVMLRRDPPDNRWKFDQSSCNHLQAAISLSLYTNAARLTYATGKAHISTPTTSQKSTQGFHRIVGYAKTSEVLDRTVEMQEWLGFKVESSTFSRMQNQAGVQIVKMGVEAIGELDHLPWSEQLARPFQKANTTMETMRQLRKDTAQLSKILRLGVDKSYLGMFLSSLSNRTEPGDDSDTHFEELLVEPFQATRAIQYAQELFSLFILALGLEVESINEEKQKKNIDADLKVSREHPVFKRIAEILSAKELVQSTEEAYVLIIPAFAKHKLLPNDPGRSVPTGRQDPADFPIPL